MKNLPAPLALFLGILCSFASTAQVPFSTGFLNQMMFQPYSTSSHLVKTTDGGLVAAGQINTNPVKALLAKTDSNGVYQWSTTVEVTPLFGLDGFIVVASPDSGIVLACSAFSMDTCTLMLTRIDKTGTVTATAVYDYPGEPGCDAAFIRSDGTLLLCGRVPMSTSSIGLRIHVFNTALQEISNTTFTPALNPGQGYSGAGFWGYAMDSQDQLWFCGSIFSSDAAYSEFLPFYACINDQMQVVSNHIYDDTLMQFKPDHIIPGTHGDVYLIGQADSTNPPAYNSSKLGIMHCDHNGEVLFFHRYHTTDGHHTNYEWRRNTGRDANGNIFVMQTRRLTSPLPPSNYNAHFLKIDSSGSVTASHYENGFNSAGLTMDNNLPAVFYMGYQNSWSQFAVIARADTNFETGCFSLGTAHSYTAPRYLPADSALTLIQSGAITSSIGTHVVVFTPRSDAGSDYCVIAAVEEEQAAAMEIKVQPNPAAQYVEITGPANQNTLRIIDDKGQLIYSGTHYGRTLIDVQNWPSGLYLIDNMTSGGIHRTERLLIVH